MPRDRKGYQMPYGSGACQGCALVCGATCKRCGAAETRPPQTRAGQLCYNAGYLPSSIHQTAAHGRAAAAVQRLQRIRKRCAPNYHVARLASLGSRLAFVQGLAAAAGPLGSGRSIMIVAVQGLCSYTRCMRTPRTRAQIALLASESRAVRCKDWVGWPGVPIATATAVRRPATGHSSRRAIVEEGTRQGGHSSRSSRALVEDAAR